MEEKSTPFLGLRHFMSLFPQCLLMSLGSVLGSVGLFPAKRTTHSRAGAGTGHAISPAHSRYHPLSSSRQPWSGLHDQVLQSRLLQLRGKLPCRGRTHSSQGIRASQSSPNLVLWFLPDGDSWVCPRRLVHRGLFIPSVANRKKSQEEDTWGLNAYERRHSPLLCEGGGCTKRQSPWGTCPQMPGTPPHGLPAQPRESRAEGAGGMNRPRSSLHLNSEGRLGGRGRLSPLK